MHVLSWVLQVLLALHTAVGAVWKFFNSEQAVPSLSTIPHGVWMGMGALELLCSLGLVLPAFHKPGAFLVPLAAACVAAEMLLFCALHLASGDPSYGPMRYWLVVAAICACIVYVRWVRRG